MDSQSYPIEHFTLMAAIAELLKAMPAQVLTHHYSYESFGSWTLVLRVEGVPLRVAFDGRELEYSICPGLSRKPPYKWGDIVWSQRLAQSRMLDARELVAAIEAAAAQLRC